MNNKIINNPNFTGNETVDTDKEVKQVQDENLEEGNREDASTSKEPTGEETGDDNEIKKQEEALTQEEEKLKQENEELERQLEARRQIIVEQRKQRREKREALKEKIPNEDNDDLSDINQEDVQRLERVLKVKGYVPKQELQAENYKQTQQQVEDEFYEKYPEYKPENDSGDILYNALKDEFAMYAQPKNPRQISNILERAHREVQNKFPNRFPKKFNSLPSKSSNSRANLAGTAAGSSGGSTKSQKKSSLTQEQQQHLLAGGWTQEEIDEM